MVVGHVVRLVSEYPKVRQLIVAVVLIFVVDDMLRLKREVLSHNFASFALAGTRRLVSSILAHGVVAGLRTKNAFDSAFSAWGAMYRSPAYVAREFLARCAYGLMEALLRAKPALVPYDQAPKFCIGLPADFAGTFDLAGLGGDSKLSGNLLNSLTS